MKVIFAGTPEFAAVALAAKEEELAALKAADAEKQAKIKEYLYKARVLLSVTEIAL